MPSKICGNLRNLLLRNLRIVSQTGEAEVISSFCRTMILRHFADLMRNDQTGVRILQPLNTEEVAAFSLIEIVVAIGLTTFCLLALLGLIPVGLESTFQATGQTVAVNLVSGVTADLRSASRTPPFTSPRYRFVLPASGDGLEALPQSLFLRDDGRGGEINTDATADAQYRVSVWLTAPSESEQKEATVARVLVTWPALADREVKKCPVHFTGWFETVTALDRN